MTILGKPMLGAGMAALALLLLWSGIGPRRATAVEPPIEFASHRAIYELKLAQSRGNSSTIAARGRILYDFSGNACEGYALQFRQVSELDNGEGRTTLSDLRSTSWEDGAAKRFIFKSQNYLNETLIDTVDGEAERGTDKVTVSLSKPMDRKFDLEPTIAFPTDHMRRIIAAAREEKNILEVPLYDGSDKGDKVFNTLTVIGRAIAPHERPPSDAAASSPHSTSGTASRAGNARRMKDLSILCGVFSSSESKARPSDDGLIAEFFAQEIDRVLGLGGVPINV